MGIPRGDSERALQAQVIALARLYGWRVAHFRPARTAKGWRTPVEGDGAGFPDLILVRGTELLAVELKGPRGRLTAAQGAWLVALEAAGAEIHEWRASDWGDIQRRLSQ